LAPGDGGDVAGEEEADGAGFVIAWGDGEGVWAAAVDAVEWFIMIWPPKT